MNKKIWFFPLLLFIVFISSDTVLSQPIDPFLKEQYQKLIGAGIPTTIEELNLPKISDEENGAFIYQEVFKFKDYLYQKYQKEWKYMPYEGTVKWDEVPEEEKKKVIDLILHDPEFAKMYQLLEKASQMKCQFLTKEYSLIKEDYEKGTLVLSENLLPISTKLRSCSRILAEKAKIEAEYGNINKSLSASLTGLRIAKSLSNDPILISQLVRIAMDNIALSTLEETINTEEGNIDLYHSLLTEIRREREKNIVAYSLKGELVISGLQGIMHYRKLAKETPSNFEKEFNQMSEKEKEEFKKKFGDEYWNEELSIYIETMIKMISFADKPYWEVRKKVENLNTELQEIPEKRAVLTKQMCTAFSRAYLQEANIDAYLGAAEIGIANQIYKNKYGSYADTLKQLVPEIIPSLPLDPFTGNDYIYKKKDKGFIVYSVGEDTKDNGGVEVQFTLKPDIVWEI